MGLVGGGMSAKREVDLSCRLSGWVDDIGAATEDGGLQLLIL